MDYYAVLGVDEDASQADIIQAYRREALRWHPDKCEDENATEKFQEIGQAFAVLRDADRRQEYDIERMYSREAESHSPEMERRRRQPRKASRRSRGYAAQGFTLDEAFKTFSDFMYSFPAEDLSGGSKEKMVVKEIPYDLATKGGHVMIDLPNGDRVPMAFSGVHSGRWTPFKTVCGVDVYLRIEFPDDMDDDEIEGIKSALLGTQAQQLANEAVEFLGENAGSIAIAGLGIMAALMMKR